MGTTARDKERYAEKKLFLVNYKLEKGCIDCGYKDDSRALVFDHLPEFKKHRNVASLVVGSWKVLVNELKKCEVVCANCHAIRTLDRLGITK